MDGVQVSGTRVDAFIPWRKFMGFKNGMVFKLGANGCGYYSDCGSLSQSKETFCSLGNGCDSGSLNSRIRTPIDLEHLVEEWPKQKMVQAVAF